MKRLVKLHCRFRRAVVVVEGFDETGEELDLDRPDVSLVMVILVVKGIGHGSGRFHQTGEC